MAVKDYDFLDEVGVQTLANYLLEKVNARISDRIISDPKGTEAAKVDNNHVVSAKTVMDLIGTGTGDLTEDLTGLQNQLQQLSTKVDGFTHLKIETWIGDIEDVVDPKSDTFYFQKDAPEMDHDDQGFLVDADGARVSETDDDSKPYYAYIDPDTQEVVKHDGTAIVQDAGTNVVLDPEDPIFDQVKIIEDTTWTIYAYVPVSGSDEGEMQWINFGDFDVELANYWSKSDEDIEALRNRLNIPTVTPITDDAILQAVDAAFTATKPAFEDTKVMITLDFKAAGASVGTQQVEVNKGVQNTITYTSMTPPSGYRIKDTENTGITFTCYTDSTIDVEVEVIPKQDQDAPGAATGVQVTMTADGVTKLSVLGNDVGDEIALVEGADATLSGSEEWKPRLGSTVTLKDNTAYTIFSRKPGDETHNVSPASAGFTFTYNDIQPATLAVTEMTPPSEGNHGTFTFNQVMSTTRADDFTWMSSAADTFPEGVTFDTASHTVSGTYSGEEKEFTVQIGTQKNGSSGLNVLTMVREYKFTVGSTVTVPEGESEGETVPEGETESEATPPVTENDDTSDTE